MIREALSEEIESDDYTTLVHEITKDPLRCFIVTRGPEGVVNELAKFIGPSTGDVSQHDGPFERYWH